MTATASEPVSETPFFKCPGDVFNEVFAADGSPRNHWTQVLECLQQIPDAEFSRRMQQAGRMLRDNGVTYHAFADTAQQARPWQLDLMPVVISGSELGMGIGAKHGFVELAGGALLLAAIAGNALSGARRRPLAVNRV